MFYLQTGEELGELGEERQENKPDEAGLRGRFGHLVAVHERSHRKPLEFLCVALRHNKGFIQLSTHTANPLKEPD